jgi:hypothetical protein
MQLEENIPLSSLQSEQVDNKGPSEKDIEQFKQNRRQASKSLDITSKAFVPTRKVPTLPPPSDPNSKSAVD